MKRRYAGKLILVVVVSLALVWLVIALVVLPAAAQGPQPEATVRYVAPGGDCGGLTPCYASVQAAVDAVGFSSTDEIRVAQGTYTGVSARAGITQVVYLSRTVIIRGGYTTSDWGNSYPITRPTILDAQWQGRVFVLTGNISPTIDGLKMMRGNATGLKGGYRNEDAGGAVFIEDARGTLANNTIISSTGSTITTAFSTSGGGIYLYNSNISLQSNTVFSNTARSGGGIASYGGSPHLTGNTVSSNLGSSGGGILLEQSPALLSGNFIISNTGDFGGGLELTFTGATLTGNVIRGNTADFGGGLYAGGPATVTNNLILENTCPDGFAGGLELTSGRPDLQVVKGNVIAGNTAGIGGGVNVAEDGIIFEDNIVRGNSANEAGALWSGRTSATFVNNVFADNQTSRTAAGIEIQEGSPIFVHTTIARNQGPDGAGLTLGLSTMSAVTASMSNTILVHQAVGVTLTNASSVVMNGVLWFNNGSNTRGTGAITIAHSYVGDPLFALDGYHITRNSAARDRGVDAGVADDIDGESRPSGPAPDLGADEYIPWTASHFIYLPTIMR